MTALKWMVGFFALVLILTPLLGWGQTDTIYFWETDTLVFPTTAPVPSPSPVKQIVFFVLLKTGELTALAAGLFVFFLFGHFLLKGDFPDLFEVWFLKLIFGICVLVIGVLIVAGLFYLFRGLIITNWHWAGKLAGGG